MPPWSDASGRPATPSLTATLSVGAGENIFSPTENGVASVECGSNVSSRRYSREASRPAGSIFHQQSEEKAERGSAYSMVPASAVRVTPPPPSSHCGSMTRAPLPAPPPSSSASVANVETFDHSRHVPLRSITDAWKE